ASYAPAATGVVVPWVSVQGNAAVMSAPLARGCKSTITVDAPTRAHVVGWPSSVIDQAADTEPRAAVSGLQLLHAGLLASANNAAMEQRSFVVMTYYLLGISWRVGCGAVIAAQWRRDGHELVCEVSCGAVIARPVVV